jgi:2',3'-cyclic-nucleotide 2'-phosphodiesterase (5'-nucleotidase family)
MRGNMEVCDCTHPRGSLPRRIGYLEAFRKKFKETPVLQVEAGNWSYDSTGYLPAVMLQNEQMMRGMSRWGVDVVNLGRYDVIYAQKLLARDGLAERTDDLSAIKNLISANGVFGDEVAPPAPYLIKEVTGPRIKGKLKKLRVAFVGLAEPIRPGDGLTDSRVTDMFQTARRVVPKARKESDVLVIVAHCEMNAAMRLATENPEADVVIAGNSEGLFKPRLVGNTLIVMAAPGYVQQSDLRLYISNEGKISYRFRATDLDAAVPSDPAAQAFTEAARRDREKLVQH